MDFLDIVSKVPLPKRLYESQACCCPQCWAGIFRQWVEVKVIDDIDKGILYLFLLAMDLDFGPPTSRRMLKATSMRLIKLSLKNMVAAILRRSVATRPSRETNKVKPWTPERLIRLEDQSGNRSQ